MRRNSHHRVDLHEQWLWNARRKRVPMCARVDRSRQQIAGSLRWTNTFVQRFRLYTSGLIAAVHCIGTHRTPFEVVLNHSFDPTSDIGRRKTANPMTASDFAIQYGAASVGPLSIGVNRAVFTSRFAAHEFCRWLNSRHYTSFMAGRAIYF